MGRHFDPDLVQEAIDKVMLENKVYGLKDKLNEAAGVIQTQVRQLNDREYRIARLERVPRWVRWLFRAV